ncbi:MAG TPA: cellulose synthase subunit BcsC-related outer membrane protein [Steroidobacteraceae bacterium]|nr:cellulose synthase subunit BcsC-related outer membrane protein [Steroidobacteraceae bacterium]
MGLTVALVATLTLAASALAPEDAAGWRARSEALYAQGDFPGALDAAERARQLAPTDPWARYAWARALAAVDPDAARRALPGIGSDEILKAFPDEERARFETAVGYLCLDLGIEPLAALHFGEVPPSATSHAEAQAGLAILAVRRGNARLALEHFDAARATVRQDPSLAELERNARYDVVLHDFQTARDLRDANAAGRAYSVLDELRPNHPSTLQARADLAELRGDMAARERALRDLVAVDPKAPGAASELSDTLLALNRPYEAYDVARRLAPERLAADVGLQAIEREWIPHFEASLDGSWRSGQTDHDRLDLPAVRIAWSGSDPRWGRVRLLAEAAYPESDRVPTGEPFGTSVALPSLSDSQSDKGIGGVAQWAPRNGLLLELGTTPTSFTIDNVVGGLRFRFDSPSGSFSLGIDRTAVDDSLLAYAGTVDPVSGRTWGGVVSDRVYFGGSVGDETFSMYGALSAADVDGHRVDSNTEWRGDAGFLQRAASGDGWIARIGGNVEALGYSANRSHFTLGHGGYFSPEKFLSIGPVFEIEGRRADRSFRVEGGVTWQEVREESSDYFPEDADLQAATGNLRYPADSRDGVGLHLAASVEWRVTARAVAGVRLEGMRGEDADQIRLQVYTRRWDHSVTDPVQQPPVPLRAGPYYVLY